MSNRLFLAGEIVFAGLDEGFRHRRNFFNRSIFTQKRGIDIVREDLAGYAAPCHLRHLRRHSPFPALRKIG